MDRTRAGVRVESYGADRFRQRKNYLFVKNESKGHVPSGPRRYEIFAKGGVNGEEFAEEGFRRHRKALQP